MPAPRMVALAFVTATAATSGAAQAVCHPGAETSESKLLAFFAGPLAFAWAPGVPRLEQGEWALAGSLTLVPRPPASIARSTGVCGFSKAENSDLSPVFPQPRVMFGLGGRVVVEASWLPPVTVADATPHLSAVALSWASRPYRSSGIRLTLRAHATIGGVNGPITCPRSELQNTSASQPCFGSEPSDDRYEPNVRGFEIAGDATTGRWRWHAGSGLNMTRARLRVDFTDGRGFVDRNIVEVDLARMPLFGGISWHPEGSLALSAQVYSVPGDATTARMGLAWPLR